MEDGVEYDLLHEFFHIHDLVSPILELLQAPLNGNAILNLFGNKSHDFNHLHKRLHVGVNSAMEQLIKYILALDNHVDSESAARSHILNVFPEEPTGETLNNQGSCVPVKFHHNGVGRGCAECGHQTEEDSLSVHYFILLLYYKSRDSFKNHLI